MEEIIKRIKLDINAESNQQVVFLRHMESGRRVEFILNQSGVPYYVENDKRAFVSGHRPDDLPFNNAAEVSNGRVIYEITRQNTSAVGTVEAELRIIGEDDELLISAPFKFEVSETIYKDGDVPIDTPEATALTQLITEATAAINATNASVIKDAEVIKTENGGEPAAAVELEEYLDGKKIKLYLENIDGKDGVSPEVKLEKTANGWNVIIEDVNGRKEMLLYHGTDGFSPTLSVVRQNGAAVLKAKDRYGETSASVFDGKDGVDGKPGFSPIVNVAKANGVTTIAVTDSEGAKIAEILDGAPGKDGDKGDKGDKGEKGETGEAGKDGTNGKDGVSPTISVSKSNGETAITITDANGTKRAYIKDGVNGANGVKGEDGISPVVNLYKSGGVTTLNIADVNGLKTAEIKDGTDGNAIYAVRDSSTSYSPTFTRDTILNGDRPLQVGDLLLSQYNGYLYQIYELGDSTVEARYTGSTLKGAQGDAGAPGKDGADGKDGAPGADGFSPTIDVSKNGKTTTLTITDKNGTKTAEIKDGADGSGGGSGGGGADLLNENGVIKQEHLPEGYPYADGEVKTFINNPELMFIEDIGGFASVNPITETPVVGLEYTVNWNGTEYTTVCQAYEEEGVMLGWAFGNLGAMTGQGATSEPFVAVVPTEAGFEMLGFGLLIVPLDGSTSVFLSVSGFCGTLQKIDKMYLPTEGDVIWFRVVGDFNSSASTQSHSNEDIIKAVRDGKNVIFQHNLSGISLSGNLYQLCHISSTDVTFSRVDYTGVETVKVKEDGTFEYHSTSLL